MRFLILTAAILATGCFDATVSDPGICTSQNFPAPPGNIPPGIPGTFTFSDPVNLSDTLGKVNDLSDHTTATITELSISDANNGMSWISHMDLVVQDTSGSSLTVATYDADPNNPAGTTVNLTVQSGDVYALLSQGQVTMTAIVTGITPSQVPNLTADFCMSLSAHASKSLL